MSFKGVIEDVSFGEMRAGDAADAAVLAAQLGYPCPAADLVKQMEILSKNAAEQVRVARLGPKVVGWIHFQERQSLTSGPRVEISQVVVDETLRGKGIGKGLCALAEEWGRARGLPRIRLASQIKRTQTHQFYLSLGYTIDKTSHVFSKPLAADPKPLASG
jgi:GNAT superfamily N-acetyltransferase